MTSEAPGEGCSVPSTKHRVTERCGRSCSTALTKTQGRSHLKVSQMSACGEVESSQWQQHTLIHQGQDLRGLMGSKADTLAGENCIR